MSYTPTEWQNGDTITAEKLNNMESGIENANNPFIVTCTPTAQDYSGTMDKTIAEITAAYQAGKRIVFRMMLGASEYMDVDCTARYTEEDLPYPSFNGFIVTDSPSDMIIFAFTASSTDGTRNTYFTYLYPLENPFIVTLTPTALDYSGEMDKTVAEITAAYQAGRQIVFRLYTEASVYIDVPVQLVGTDADFTYPSFEAIVIQASTNLMVSARTNATNYGTKNTYSTNLYTLTPMS